MCQKKEDGGKRCAASRARSHYASQQAEIALDVERAARRQICDAENAIHKANTDAHNTLVDISWRVAAQSRGRAIAKAKFDELSPIGGPGPEYREYSEGYKAYREVCDEAKANFNKLVADEVSLSIGDEDEWIAWEKETGQTRPPVRSKEEIVNFYMKTRAAHDGIAVREATIATAGELFYTWSRWGVALPQTQEELDAYVQHAIEAHAEALELLLAEAVAGADL